MNDLQRKDYRQSREKVGIRKNILNLFSGHKAMIFLCIGLPIIAIIAFLFFRTKEPSIYYALIWIICPIAMVLMMYFMHKDNNHYNHNDSNTHNHYDDKK